MIEKQGNYYILQCDFCSNNIDDLEDFQDALDYKKLNNWKSVNIKGEWFDKCIDCIERNK